MADNYGMGSVSAKGSDNKTEVRTTFGDSDPLEYNENDQPGDYAHDTAGFGADIGPNTKADMDMALPSGSSFPHQTGHDSLTPEEAQLS